MAGGPVNAASLAVGFVTRTEIEARFDR